MHGAGLLVLLTILLHATGGPSNPFSILYLVYITLAAVVLGLLGERPDQVDPDAVPVPRFEGPTLEEMRRLEEKLNALEVTAILVSVTGIVTAISNRKMKLNIPFKGLMFALGGALGQSGGIILSKKGIGTYDALAATQIRALFGLVGFAVMITLMNRWSHVIRAFRDKAGMQAVTVGAVFGPFVGVALALFSIQHTNTGIASTLMALVPIFIIWPSSVMFNEKIKIQQIVGAIISIIGVSLFFM